MRMLQAATVPEQTGQQLQVCGAPLVVSVKGGRTVDCISWRSALLVLFVTVKTGEAAEARAAC